MHDSYIDFPDSDAVNTYLADLIDGLWVTVNWAISRDRSCPARLTKRVVLNDGSAEVTTTVAIENRAPLGTPSLLLDPGIHGDPP
jgi:hypothetical protein